MPLGTLGNRPRTADAEMVVYPFNHHEGGEAFQSARQLSWLHDRFLAPGGDLPPAGSAIDPPAALVRNA